MNLVSVRIITPDINRLVGFYEQITGIQPTWYTPDFAEMSAGSITLAIGSIRTLSLFGMESSPAGNHHQVIIEFRVHDVDAEFERVRSVIGRPVQEPTTMPWGNRSLLFRDPDGNLVNFFTPATPEAMAKFKAPIASLPGTPQPRPHERA